MALAATFLGFLSSTADASSYSPLGNVSPAADGLLVVCPLSRNVSANNMTTTGVTVGGIAASIVATAASVPNPGAIAALEVVAGTYAIGVTYSGTGARCGAACYLLTGYASPTPVFTATNASGANVTSRMVTLDYPAGGGVAIYSVLHANTGATTWSGATPAHDTTVESLVKMSSAYRTASGAGISETASWTGSVQGTLVGAVWEPAAAPTVTARGGLLLAM